MSSPVFSESTLETIKSKYAADVSGESMTLKGAVNKSIILFLTMLVPAAWIWWKIGSPEEWAGAGIKGYLIGSIIVAVLLSIAISIKPIWAQYLAPVYAAAEGVFIGLVSRFFEAIFPGIVLEASSITLLIFAGMLLAYRSGWLRATPMFTKIIVFATIGVGVFYLITMIMSMFGVQSFYQGNGTLSIIVSVVVAGIAAFNLILDFDLIDRSAAAGAPKWMEWYCGFGLLVTIVWLYIEILRLLAKLSSRD